MRKPILIAAGLAAVSVGLGSPGRANPMFSVSASSAGSLTFTGAGTASFNNSIGTNNSFQVGSSTNLGVNASTSSTPEYGVTSTATLDLAGTSNLQQVIGTAGTFRKSEYESQSAYSQASTYAANAMSNAGWGSSYESGAVVGGTTYTSAAAWESDYKAAYEVNVEKGYAAAGSYEAARTNSSGTNGVISGSFRTVESGSARASGSASDWSNDAASAANAAYGSSWGGSSSGYSSEADWQAAWNSSYNSAYAQSSAASNRFSDSAVTVRGIGSDADVTAAATSKFSVVIDGNDGVNGGSTATANGSAGANLATSSFANQSQSSTASAFMQAFGGSGT